MLLAFGIGLYSLIGIVLSAALLTDNHTNTCKTDAFFCCIAGPVWPLAIGAAAGFALHDNLKDKRYARKRLENDFKLKFSSKLLKLQLISAETHYKVRSKLNDR